MFVSSKQVCFFGRFTVAKALSCAVSVVKANHVQDGATTSRVCREISVSMATNGPFWQNDLLPLCLSVGFGKMILPRLTSSIPAGFWKLNCHWSLFKKKLCILG